MVIPASISTEDGDVIREIGTTSRRFRPPQVVTMLLERDRISYWVGRKSELLAEIACAEIEYSVGSVATTAGAFNALIAASTVGGKAFRLPIFPMSDRSGWFPRQPTVAEIDSIIESLDRLRA